MKQIKLLAIAWLLAVSASATNFQERTENWLKPGENTGSSEPAQYIGPPTPDPNVPVSDGLYVLLALAGIYCVAKWGKKRFAHSFRV